MKVTEPGYYWYLPNGVLVPEVVKVTSGYGFFTGSLIVWFFGSEVEITLIAAEKEGTFKGRIEYAN